MAYSGLDGERYEAMKPVTVKVSKTGRMHLPAEVRRALGLKAATKSILTLDDDAVRLRTPAQTLEHIRAWPGPISPKAGSPRRS